MPFSPGFATTPETLGNPTALAALLKASKDRALAEVEAVKADLAYRQAYVQVRQIESYGFNATEVAGQASTESAGLGTRLNELAERIGRSAHGDGWRCCGRETHLASSAAFLLVRLDRSKPKGATVLR